MFVGRSTWTANRVGTCWPWVSMSGTAVSDSRASYSTTQCVVALCASHPQSGTGIRRDPSEVKTRGRSPKRILNVGLNPPFVWLMDDGHQSLATRAQAALFEALWFVQVCG